MREVTRRFQKRLLTVSSRSLKTYAPPRQAEVVDVIRDAAKARIAQIDAQRTHVSPFLVDSFHRRHDYLRISLTERCNLRCFYCMPNEGVELSPAEHILTNDEIIRLATLFVKNGVRKIRLTGGEPTVRKDLVDIVARLNQLREFGLKSIGMTTNGIALHRKLPSLIENGLTHLNISLDTMDPYKFEIMTRRMGHEAVLRSLNAALASPQLQSVKLNMVVIKGLNDHEVPDFLELTRDQNLSVRFIEFMPFTGNKWDKAKMVPSSGLLSHIEAQHPLVIKAPDELNDTARSYLIPGYKGSFGFISSMSDHFCGSCNRLRLTADGQIKVCLFDAKEISLRDLMRGGATDAELEQTIGRAVHGKKEKHAGMEEIDVTTNRPMILIGGVTQFKGFSSHYPTVTRTSLSPLSTSRQWILPQSVTSRHVRLYSTSPSDSETSSPTLTHIDSSGRPNMVDVSPKDPTKRIATAVGTIYIPKVAYDLITDPTLPSNQDTANLSPLDRAKIKAKSKGDVLTVAQLAAIMGCKRTSELIPLCHPLQLSHISVKLYPESSHYDNSGLLSQQQQRVLSMSHCHDSASVNNPGSVYSIKCEATVTCEGKTGVEMEALTAVSVGLLTVWDMLKAVAGKDMIIGDIFVQNKQGGKSGDFVRKV
ncbi:radical SAM superfamily protein [Abortiporus biennis]